MTRYSSHVTNVKHRALCYVKSPSNRCAKRLNVITAMLCFFISALLLTGCSELSGNKEFSTGKILSPEDIESMYAEIAQTQAITQTGKSSVEDSTKSIDITVPVGYDENLTVYWTPSGKVWHTQRDCVYIINNKNVLSGSLKNAVNDGKIQECSVCADAEDIIATATGGNIDDIP